MVSAAEVVMHRTLRAGSGSSLQVNSSQLSARVCLKKSHLWYANDGTRSALQCEKRPHYSPKPTERGDHNVLECNTRESAHWLVGHYECALWGSGSTRLSRSPWEELQSEATRANRRYETNTGFSYCGNPNLSPGEEDILLHGSTAGRPQERKTCSLALFLLHVFFLTFRLALRKVFPGGVWVHFSSRAKNCNELD